VTRYPLLEPDGPQHGSSWASAVDADLRDSDIRAFGRPHVVLGCGHLCPPPGGGPLAQSGYGWCLAHGEVPVAALDAEASSARAAD